MPRFMQYAMVAAKEALDDAGWRPEDPNDLEMTVSSSSTFSLPPTITHSSLRVSVSAPESVLSKTSIIPLSHSQNMYSLPIP